MANVFNIEEHRYDIKQEELPKQVCGWQRNDMHNGLSTTMVLLVTNWKLKVLMLCVVVFQLGFVSL